MADDLQKAVERDRARLLWLLRGDHLPEGFVESSKDRYDRAIEVARENGREIPTDDDELEGFRRMIDEAMQNEALEVS